MIVVLRVVWDVYGDVEVGPRLRGGLRVERKSLKILNELHLLVICRVFGIGVIVVVSLSFEYVGIGWGVRFLLCENIHKVVHLSKQSYHRG